jgi:coenzyme F420-reducing hydrogenase beta subunit
MTVTFRTKKVEQILIDVQSVETRPGNFIVTLKDGNIMKIAWDNLVKITN